MHPTMPTYLAYVLVILVALVHIVSADFDLYKSRSNGDYYFWTVHEPAPLEPDWYRDPVSPACSMDLVRLPAFLDHKDVSGKRFGVRCVGDTCAWNYDPFFSGNIQTLEMHFSNDPHLHFTVYETKPKGRGYMTLYGVDNQDHGKCYRASTPSYNCKVTDDKGYVHVVEGDRRLRCESRFTAKYINDAYTYS